MSKHTNREVNNFPNNAAKFSRCLSMLFASYFFLIIPCLAQYYWLVNVDCRLCLN